MLKCATDDTLTTNEGELSFTGSITENRIYVGIPPLVRQHIYDEARALSITVPEYVRHILIEWHADRIGRAKANGGRKVK